MDEHIGIFVAWPYANGDLHLGHIAGAYLPADIFARFRRLRGDHVLMVSGSDAHGTPVTLQAEAQGLPPRDYFERYHRRFLDDWARLGISFDLFTHTDTENHAAVAQGIFRTLYDQTQPGDMSPITNIPLAEKRVSLMLTSRLKRRHERVFFGHRHSAVSGHIIRPGLL